MTELTTDILVIGSGAAGISAAAGASQSKNKVILIEKNTFLGGTATGAEVRTICGSYAYSHEPTTSILSGFPQEFIDQLQSKSQTEPIKNNLDLHFLPYSIDAYEECCLEFLNKYDVEHYFSSTLIELETEDKTIKSAIIEMTDGTKFNIRFKSIIDCSGANAVGNLVNHPIIQEEQHQAAAQVFTLSNVESHSEHSFNLNLIKAISNGIRDGVLSEQYKKTYTIPGSYSNNEISLKIGLNTPVTGAKNNNSELIDEGKNAVLELHKFLTTNTEYFQNVKLKSIARSVGVRVLSRPQGKKVLTGEMVLSGTKSKDGIAVGTWPIEIWDQSSKVHLEFLSKNDHYLIPLECLQSNTYANLFFGGKNISADQRGIASARVIGTSLQTGFASGQFAAMWNTAKDQQEIIQSIRDKIFLPIFAK